MVDYMIIEDERFAYEEMKRIMSVLRPSYHLQAWVSSVKDAVFALRNTVPDLLIIDIRLSDGLCFDVFGHISVNTPVIFTTAYDEYALRAFRVNSIDYLLKPIEEKDLERALVKFETNNLPNPASAIYHSLATTYLGSVKKNRFLVSIGDTFRHVDTSNIAFFYSEEKYNYLHTFEGKRYIINYSLEQLETMLGHNDFFRVSRNCIANIKSVRKVSKFFGGRLLVNLSPDCPLEIIVSRSRADGFLKWLDGL
ncbi:LytTR family DNA-binding domain-containing protein [uncultured Bacteroides sp.]|jgi:two component transcriptional regulator|uniref:LytR/AlgR family response regulator transcription factor n=1 Tax=uncultured Bacteroides sp. TaxID=162156 RepID=UPI00280ABD5C|nr:LytTR family DNA-binding domain-containing protein [uncultured Bacteroides sp.]